MREILPDGMFGAARWQRRSGVALAAGCAWLAASAGALAQEIASPWVQGHNVRTRLVAGVTDLRFGSTTRRGAIVAGLEMELAEGWKTYWRSPGDAGGVPPEFDFAGSNNVAATRVTYPAPMRITDRAGSTIGYKKHVVFPIHVEPEKRSAAVTLKLQLAFGVCLDICVPSEGSYEVKIPGSDTPAVPEVLAAALARLPVDTRDGFWMGGAPGEVLASPTLTRVVTELEGAAPKVTMHVAFPNGTEGADVFVEGPPGEFVPLPKQVGKVDDTTLIFGIDLTKGADVKALKGKELRATMVSERGASERVFVLK